MRSNTAITLSLAIWVVLGTAQIALAEQNVKICVEVVQMEEQDLPPNANQAPDSELADQAQPGDEMEDEEEADSAEEEAEEAAEDETEEEFEEEYPSSQRDLVIEHLEARLAFEAQRRQQLESSYQAYLPIGQTPLIYLKRLVEHFITHEKGFEAVSQNCQETIRVELYPLRQGWTVFARYSKNGREERVDRLHANELSQFSERAVLALLNDLPISATINRENVLRADSEKSTQTIRGSNHFSLAVGTQLRVGQFSTASGAEGELGLDWRTFSPVAFSAGYRGKFENWAIEGATQIGIGTQTTKRQVENPNGGHIDFGGTVELQLHFFRYFDPRGLISFYLGSGATFELMWFYALRPLDAGFDDRSNLFSGGLDLDLVAGWEFMRAANVQFFLQAELHVPCYVVQAADDNGSIDKAYFPGLSFKLGVLF